MARADQACQIGCLVVSGLVFLVLLLVSFKGLPATQFALLRNGITGVIYYDTVFEGGRNCVGFWNGFIQFPATIESLEWLDGTPMEDSTKDLAPMDMRTQDGLMVTLGIVVQYKLIRDNIPQMYQRFGNSYENFFVSNVRMGFQEVLSRHDAEDLWATRLEVSKELEQECRSLAKGRIGGFIECWGVQMLSIKVHQEIEDKIVERQVQVQWQDLQRTKRIAIQIRAQTDVNASEFDRDIAIARANASAQAYRTQQQATAEASRKTRLARAEGLRYVRGNVTAAGRLSNQQLIKYTELTAMSSSKRSQLLFGPSSRASVVVGIPSASAGTKERRLHEPQAQGLDADSIAAIRWSRHGEL